MGMEVTIQSTDREVVALHFGSDRKVALRILLNVSEVSHRSTAGGKEVIIVSHMDAH